MELVLIIAIGVGAIMFMYNLTLKADIDSQKIKMMNELQEQTEKEIDKVVIEQLKEIRQLFPNIGEQELKFISICLRSTYVKGAMNSLKLNKQTQ